MMKKTTLLLSVFISVILSVSISSAFLDKISSSEKSARGTVFDRVMRTGVLNIGYYLWAPYVMKDPNTNRLSGINYDIMEAIGRNLGLKVNWTMEVGVGEAGAALEVNKFDLVGITIWPAPARYRVMTFSARPQFYAAIYAVARIDDKRFETDLSKANAKEIKTIGMEGDYSAEMAKELLPNATHLTLPASASPSEFLLQLVTKKADILFVDKGGVNEFSKTNPDKIRVLEEIGPVRVFGEHMALKRGEYQLRDMIDVALLQLINDGTVDKLVRKYRKEYGVDIFPPHVDVNKHLD